HADALAIDLSVHGVPILVDAGTGAYVGPRRRHFRGTAAHNTVTIDGADSSEQGTAFTWRSATGATLHGYATAADASFTTASHEGYRRLVDPVRHHRAILRIAGRYWAVLDALDAQASHAVSFTWQGAAAIAITPRTPHTFALQVGDVTLLAALDPRLEATIEQRVVSPAYALEVPAPAIVASAEITGAACFCSVFGSTDDVGTLDVQAVGDGAAWLVRHDHGQDLVAAPHGRTVQLGPVGFDGTVLALLGGGDPHTIVAAGAGTLQIAGRSYTLGDDDLRIARRATDGTWTMDS
ncbi:MAG TPA: heparinase II/III-family protein, partial [Gemmatimonadaceae bacterium]|nr:heparinase II/III-family protein [Gemmatimonadaceae bacterium]